jgi:hypothetical protein
VFRNILLAGFYTLFRVQGYLNTRAAQRIKYIQYVKSGWVTNMPVFHVLYSRYKNKCSCENQVIVVDDYTENEGKENKKYNELLSKLYLSTLL